MKILVLTPINPILAGDVYVKLVNHFAAQISSKKLSIISYPFFAQVKADMKDQEYMPNFFAMVEASFEKDLQSKLYKEKNVILVGNTYRKQKFDIVIALDYQEGEVFDSYIQTLIDDEDYERFNELVKITHLYTPAEAEINLPTIDHVMLFIEEALKDDEPNRKNANKFKS